MRCEPRFSSFSIRNAVLVGSTVLLLMAGSGCAQRGPRGDYALPIEQRPLEVPPELNLAVNNDGRQGPALASVVQATQTGATQANPIVAPTAPVTSATNMAAAASGFTVSGSREQVYEALGQILTALDGVTIASRSQMLTSFDVSFADSRFLLRVTTTETGTRVSAVDARGLPVTETGAVQLLEILKTKL